MGETARVRVRVPSKINLFLAVRGRRDDGLHDLVSVLQTVGLYDELTAVLHGSGLGHHPAVRCFMELDLEHDGGPSVPTGSENLVVQAGDALLAALGCDTDHRDRPEVVPRTSLQLRKQIPVAAGMAGGSADAAAALVACNRLWTADLDAGELRGIATDLGSDVPFCVSGGTALVTGTGTETASVLCRGRFHWVIGIASRSLATPEVYRAWDEHGTATEDGPERVLEALRAADPSALGRALHNDLQPAAFHLRPELREDHEALLAAGALGAVVSGAGPTLLGLASDRGHARQLAAAVADRFHRVEIAASPVGGPELTEHGSRQPPSSQKSWRSG